MRCKLTCAYCLDNDEKYTVTASKRKEAVELMEGHIKKRHLNKTSKEDSEC